MPDLYQDLLAMDVTKRKIIKGAFALVDDGILEVCPLTNLVIEKGWYTETQIKLLHSSGTWGKPDHPLTMEVLGAIENEYQTDYDAVGNLYLNWDRSDIVFFPEFLKRWMWESNIK